MKLNLGVLFVMYICMYIVGLCCVDKINSDFVLMCCLHHITCAGQEGEKNNVADPNTMSLHKLFCSSYYCTIKLMHISDMLHCTFHLHVTHAALASR